MARRNANQQADMAQQQAAQPAVEAPTAPAPPAAAAAPTAPVTPDYAAELQQLASLHEQGILTDVEFEAKKKAILAA